MKNDAWSMFHSPPSGADYLPPCIMGASPVNYAPINVNPVGVGGGGVRARGGDLMPETIPLSGF